MPPCLAVCCVCVYAAKTELLGRGCLGGQGCQRVAQQGLDGELPHIAHNMCKHMQIDLCKLNASTFLTFVIS